MTEHDMTEHDMTARPGAVTHTGSSGGKRDWATAGVVMGALGAVAAVWAYWMVVPGIIFGIAAIALGIRARRRSSAEVGNMAIALGIVALLLVPSVLVVVDGAEDWGRNCALEPTNPDC